MSWSVPLFDLSIGEEEAEAVTAVLDSKMLSMGTRTAEFERIFSRRLGALDAVMVSSGTAALHLAVRASDIGRGDEVIVPSLSFVATASVVTLTGAKPVFADIVSAQQPTIDPAAVGRLISSKSRAVIAMHYAGYPADLAALRRLCDDAGLILIEDAAHAPCVESAAGAVGTVGDYGCFSFYATKNIAGGEGGMVVARDPARLDRVRQDRSHGLTVSTRQRQRGSLRLYDLERPGLNYRPGELGAAIAAVQFGRQVADRRLRNMLVGRYRHNLHCVAGLTLPFDGSKSDSAHHLMPILLARGADRGRFRKHMHAEGIQTGVHYPPIHLFTYYRRRRGRREGRLPVTEDTARRLVSLPIHGGLSCGMVDRVCGVVAVAAEVAAHA